MYVSFILSTEIISDICRGLQAGEFAHLQLTTDITPDFILFHINYI